MPAAGALVALWAVGDGDEQRRCSCSTAPVSGKVKLLLNSKYQISSSLPPALQQSLISVGTRRGCSVPFKPAQTRQLPLGSTTGSSAR